MARSGGGRKPSSTSACPPTQSLLPFAQSKLTLEEKRLFFRLILRVVRSAFKSILSLL